MQRKKIKSEHHRGRMVEVTTALRALASQEGCDDSPYDEMVEAAEYIEELEAKIRDLEIELEPHREMEKRLIEKIRVINEKIPMVEKKVEALAISKGSHSNQPVLGNEYYNGVCIICGGSQTFPDHATITKQCIYCGQKYREGY